MKKKSKRKNIPVTAQDRHVSSLSPAAVMEMPVVVVAVIVVLAKEIVITLVMKIRC
jgi:hypothetical protein